MVDKVTGFILDGLFSIVSTILGRLKMIKLILVIFTLPLPLYLLGKGTVWATAWFMVISSNRSIAIDTYATGISTTVGIVVFVYTVLWFYRINSCLDTIAQKVAVDWEAKENSKKGEKGDGS